MQEEVAESSSEPLPAASQAPKGSENDLAGQLSALLSRRGGPIEVGAAVLRSRLGLGNGFERPVSVWKCSPKDLAKA